VSRLLVAQRALTVPGWAKDALWRRARAVPSLDLRFADNKSLVDATTGANLVDFTRARVTNILLRSEEFDTTWTPTRASVTANTTLAPNGTATADSLIEDSTASASHFLSQTVTFAAGSYTFFCHLKANTRSAVRLICFDNTTTFAVYFDMSTGTVGSTTGGATGSISLMADGWYRCSITFTAAAGTGYARVGLAVAGSQSYTGDGTSGIYLWGAQLEQSATVGEYIPTTSTINSAPRFDHDPTTGESLGLLVEEQRTNLLLQSEDFSTTWTTRDATVSTNQVTAPDGATTADKIIETATNGEHHTKQDTASQVAGTYSASIFAKAGERDVIQFVGTGPLGVFRANFDLTNGVIGSADSALNARITPFPNGWYRCNITATSTTTGALRAQWNIVTSPTAARVESYLGDVTKGLYLWGAQLEEGAFPTSYIPTTTAAVTRNADVASITGSNFSSWYRQDEGTVFSSATSRTATTLDSSGTALGIAAFTNGTNAERIRHGALTYSTIWIDGNTPQASLAFGDFVQGQQIVLTSAFKVDDFALARDGNSVKTDTSGTLPTVTQVALGRSTFNTGSLTGTIRRLTYWPQRLSNSTLQQITQ
jgi:hypothetical protein